MEREEEKTRCVKKGSQKKKGILGMVGVGILVLLITAGVTLFVEKEDGGKVKSISKSSLEKVIEINDLSTLDYTYNAISAVCEEGGDKVKYYVAYEGTVTAGIDITQIRIDLDEEKKKIQITIPEAEIQDVSVDMGTLDFIFTADRYETEVVSQEAYKASIKDLEKKAKEEKKLLSMAKENAVAAMQALIAPWVEQVDGEFEVEVK